MKTKLEILLSAEAAAYESLACKNQFEAEDLANSTFKEQKLDPRDWDFWHNNYSQRRQVYAQYAKEKSSTPNTQE